MNHEKGLRSQTSPRALGHKMQPDTLEWTLGCITSSAWGLLTIPGTLHPVPHARPYGAWAVPPYSWDLFADWAARRPSSPPPTRGLKLVCTRCAQRRHKPPPTQDASAAGGSHETSQDAIVSPIQDARAWEGAARPQGLFPSYACR